jgi:Protein of unknown function (DUF1573)
MSGRIMLVLLLASSLLMACGKKKSGVNSDIVNNPLTADGKGNPDELAEISFKETQFNFGEIIQGQVVETDFEFTNTGKNDLVIYDAKGSCGCTVPEYPKEPISPGKSNKIHVKFDSTNKEGHQTKTVTLTCNTQPNQVTLQIVGDVIIN